VHLYRSFEPPPIRCFPNAALRQHLFGIQSIKAHLRWDTSIELFSLKSSAGKPGVAGTDRKTWNAAGHRNKERFFERDEAVSAKAGLAAGENRGRKSTGWSLKREIGLIPTD
jgi:hypothetical protein